MKKKFNLQAAEYVFPYHWLPFIDNEYGFCVGQSLSWGLGWIT